MGQFNARLLRRDIMLCRTPLWPINYIAMSSQIVDQTTAPILAEPSG